MITAARLCWSRLVRSSWASILDAGRKSTLTLVAVHRLLQVGTLACLFAAIALYMRRARLAHGSAVLALRHRSALLVDVLKRTVCKLRRDVSTSVASASAKRPHSAEGNSGPGVARLTDSEAAAKAAPLLDLQAGWYFDFG
jgi:hypothetical protein